VRTYEQIMADAKQEPAFSNGTEGYAWMDNWCWHPCKKDRNEDCPLIMASIMGVTPIEWTEVERFSLADRYNCSEFEPDDRDGDDREPEPFPQPVAEMDGQTDIFSVYADQIVEQTAEREAMPV
jgi:hypothetical protein